MKIGEVITSKRRQKGFTQEQLANAVGVTTSAVSKWETGVTCPDIALLSPIARALSVTVDELLSFGSEPTDEEIEAFAVKARAIYEAEGFDAGWAYCLRLYREYPNSPALKYTLGFLFQPFLILKENLTSEATQDYFRQTATLYEQVLASGSAKYVYRATLILISCYTMLKEIDQAEALLSHIPQQINPSMLDSSLCVLRGDYDQALRLTQKGLLNSLTQVTQALSMLGAYAREAKNTAAATRLADIGLAVTKLFGIQDFLLRRDRLCAQQLQGDTTGAMDSLQAYVQAIVDYRGVYTESDLFDRLPPEADDYSFYRRILAQSVLKDQELEPLRADPRYAAIVRPLYALAETVSHSFQKAPSANL